jgi:alpha-2-macroglobulin
MAKRAFFSIFGLLWIAAGLLQPAYAADVKREIVITENGDYFGFDLRSEKDVGLDQCKAICIDDKKCRAFTYNAKAKWCFLKTDFGELQTFAGSIAGKVVEGTGEPDLGAPAALSFASSFADAAALYRTNIIAAAPKDNKESVASLSESAFSSEQTGDARTALYRFGVAVSLSPDQSGLWAGIARAALKIVPNSDETSTLQQAAVSAAMNAYQTSRTVSERAEALSILGQALDRRQEGRPTLEAYKASLELQSSSSVQAAFADARTRYGFRVTGNTVDPDAETPRACVQFSEALTDADYKSFVTLDGAPPQTLEVSGSEICFDNLKHGGRYRISLRAGLPSSMSEVLEKPVTISAFIRDRAKSLRFSGDNFVLPGTARRGIPVVSVNADKALMELYRVGDRSLTQLLNGEQFLTQLDFYAIQRIQDEIGEPVWKGELAIKNTLNDEVTTSFPVDEALPKRAPGVYVMTARLEGDRTEEWDPRATQWFVVSDIGLTTFAGEDGLSVFARSLGTAKPLAGVALKLIAKNNELLGEAVTDADGKALFVAGLTRGASGLAPAAITAGFGSDDFVFLDMTRAGFDLSDRGVTGRPAAGALDLYAWTERGIYRAGETVHANVIVRDSAARAVDNLPLMYVFTRPDGVEDRRMASDGSALGGHSVDLALQDNAQRGAWMMKVYTDPKGEALAEKMFLVEDFVPDRIDFDLSGGKLTIGEPSNVDVAGRYLYGAPAAGLTMEGELVITPTQSWAAFPGYVFGLTEEAKAESDGRTTLEGLPALDENGKATIEVSADGAQDTSRLLTGNVVIRMRESGGRAVEKNLALEITPPGDMIGIKPGFEGGEVPEGSVAKLNVIAASAEGARIDMAGLKWSLVKVDQNYQWYRDGAAWKYEPVEFTTKIADGVINLSADKEVEIAQSVSWGRFRLTVESPEEDGPASSAEFYAGYYVPAASIETPDGLEIALDKKTYNAGETAQLKISPKFAGEALIIIGSERVLTTINASVPAGGTTLSIPVSADWGAGSYVTAVLYRPGEGQESRMPSRAIGVKWLGIDPGSRKLAITLETPDKVKPNASLTIPVAVTGAAPGEEAYVMLAAVDVGILNLTKYEPPAPGDWYFGQRQLGLEIRDIYGRLIDGSAGEVGKLRTGGDGPTASSKGAPPTEKLLALFSGIVRLDENGRAVVTLDVPQFNGTARLMAVAWSKEGLGNATKDLIIRDPVVIIASAPRFMAIGDASQMQLDFANTDGPAGEYQLKVETTGGLAANSPPATVTLGQGARETVMIPLSAMQIGDGSVTVTLAHASGLLLATTRLIPVRADTLPVTTRIEVPLAANGGSVKIDRELLSASILDGSSVSIGVSRNTAFDVPAMLMTLDRYPYGCAEQTTSRALPLLYVSELAKGAGLAEDPALKERIQGAIARVLNYQAAGGSFGLWGPGSGDLWLDSYVTDFLTRAREVGYDVPEQAMMSALENLQNALSYDVDVKSQGSEIAYAIYVLARNRRASVSDLRYYAESEINNFASPMSRAQLGASLALYGDQSGAERAFGSAFELAKATPSNSGYRSDYGSALRDGAAMLALAAESQPAIASVKDMIPYLAAVRKGVRWTSTQDEAWMLLAARALTQSNATIDIDVNGENHKGAFSTRVDGAELDIGPVSLVNKANEPVEAVITTVGSPTQPLPAGGDGFTIDRRYYSLDGTEVNVATAKQNDRFVVVLTVSELNNWPSRILVTDLLPAGFEIDNPRIVSSAELPNFSWLGATEYAHSEYRDDRFVAAFNRTGSENRQFSFAYVVRATTPGVYAQPAASVEDMYRPHLSARTATGRLEVTAN